MGPWLPPKSLRRILLGTGSLTMVIVSPVGLTCGSLLGICSCAGIIHKAIQLIYERVGRSIWERARNDDPWRIRFRIGIPD